MPIDRERLAALVNRINETSNADFVKRLLDKNRKYIKNLDGTVSTHELGYVDDGNGNAVVFPQVQNNGYGLTRYPFPFSYDRAVATGDTVQMSVPDAEVFTKHYKDYYPGFKQYGPGGRLIPQLIGQPLRNLRQRIADSKAGQRIAQELGIKSKTVELSSGETVPITATNGLLPWLLGGTNPSAIAGKPVTRFRVAKAIEWTPYVGDSATNQERYKIGEAYSKAKNYITSPERAEYERKLENTARALGYIKENEPLLFERPIIDPAPSYSITGRIKQNEMGTTYGVFYPDKNHFDVLREGLSRDTPIHEALHMMRLGDTPDVWQYERLSNSFDASTRELLSTFTEVKKQRDDILYGGSKKYSELQKTLRAAQNELIQARKNNESAATIAELDKKVKSINEEFESLPERSTLRAKSKEIQDLSPDILRFENAYRGSKAFRKKRAIQLIDTPALVDAYDGDFEAYRHRYDYLSRPSEAAVHPLATGIYLGIEPFSAYPGNAKFDNIYQDALQQNKNFQFFRHNTDNEKRLLWKAMTGSFLGVPAAGYLAKPDKTDNIEEEYRKGGKIHIKPENRGKFTALKKRTGHSASWFKAHGTPAQKKMAVFALNAKHWGHRHDTGGDLNEEEWPVQTGWAFQQQPTENIQVPYALDVTPPVQENQSPTAVQSGGLAVRPQTLAISPQVGFGLLSYAFDAARNALKKENTYQGIAPSSLPGGQKSADSEALQNILLENGYDVGKKGADGYMGRDSITALQNMLVDAGYDIGSSGEAKNGVDGILGDKTRGAYAAWIKDGARIRKQKRDTRVATQPVAEAPQEAIPAETERSAVYNPAESGNSRVYSGIYNYGQIYNPRRDNLITSTGIDLSNITANEDKRNRKVDTFSPYIFNDLNECKKESARNTLDCASHITYMNLDDARGFNIDRNGLRGDAWTMGDNVIKAGGHRLFDIFANEGAPSGKWNDATKQQTIDFVRAHAKDPEYTEFLSSNLQPGDVVELLYPGSKMFKKAYEDTDGKHQNTHIGYVVQVGGELYIRDNVGNHSTGTQSVNTRKLSSVLSGKERDGVLITGAVRVKDALGGKTQRAGRQGRDLSEFGIVPSGADDARQDRLSNDAMYRAMGALNRNKEKARKDNNLSIDEFNRIAGLAQAVMLKESGAGELFNNQSWVSNNAQLLPGLVNEENRNGVRLKRMIGHQLGAPVAFLASDLTKGAISGINSHLEPSVGLSSIKYAGPASRLTDKQRKQLGPEIKEALRESQPEASGVATFYALATSFHEVRNLLAKYAPENIKNDPDIQDQLTALAHNQGLGKIEETLRNAAADGDWDGHMEGLLKATYGKNTMLLRSYNTTDMYSKAERKEAEAQRKKEIGDLAKRLAERGLAAKALQAISASRESTGVTRANLLAQERR